MPGRERVGGTWDTGSTGGYIHGYGAGAVAVWAARSAEREAAFLPHLRPGMRLLDAG